MPPSYSPGQQPHGGPENSTRTPHYVNIRGEPTDTTPPVLEDGTDVETSTGDNHQQKLFQSNLLSSWRYGISRWIATGVPKTTKGRNGLKSLLELQNDNRPEAQESASGLAQYPPILLKDQYEQLSHMLAARLSSSAASGLKCLEELRLPPKAIKMQLDALVYIKRAHEIELARSAKLTSVYGGLLRTTVANMGPSFLSLPKRHVDVLLEELSVEEVDALLKDRIATTPKPVEQAQTDSDEDLPPQGNLLRLIDFYTLNKKVDTALALLPELPAEMLTSTAPEVLQRCTNLLKLDTVETVAGSENFKILPKILRLGISIDVPIYTVAIQNAFAAGKPGVAWDLFHYMESEGLEPHPMTYLALLRNSYLSKDIRGLNEVLTQIHETEEISSNPWLAICIMNIIRVVSRYERGDGWRTSFEQMMLIYDRAFDRSALRKLHIDLGDVASGKASGTQPSPKFLSYIIWLYAVNCTELSVVHRLWQRLTDLLKDNDPYVLEAALYPAFYDGFVLSYSLQARDLPDCLRVIYSMLEHQRCLPTTHTWTLLIEGLIKHQHTEDLLSLQAVMKEQPPSPAKDAWDKVLRSKGIPSRIADSKDELNDFERSFDGPVGLMLGDEQDMQRQSRHHATEHDSKVADEVIPFSSRPSLGDIVNFDEEGSEPGSTSAQ